jgi:hypothetical protein
LTFHNILKLSLETLQKWNKKLNLRKMNSSTIQLKSPDLEKPSTLKFPKP